MATLPGSVLKDSLVRFLCMSKREARALRSSPTIDYRGRLRSGLARKKSRDESEPTMATSGENGNSSPPESVTEHREEDRREDPEVRPEEDGEQNGRPELHLLEQLARMREMLTAKEAELAEVRSELAYAQQEKEAAKEELTGTQEELAQVKTEVDESQTRIERLHHQLEQQDQDFRAERLQGELQKMHEIEDLRKKFDWERRQWHAMLGDRGPPLSRGAGVPCQAQSTVGAELGRTSGEAEPQPTDGSEPDGQLPGGDDECLQDPPSMADPPPEGGLSNVGSGEEIPGLAEGATRRSTTETTRRVTFPGVSGTQRGPQTTMHMSDVENGKDADSTTCATNPPGTGATAAGTPQLQTEAGDAGTIVNTVTKLLEAQRHVMEVQVQALASQSVPPLRKFTGENVNTDEGSIDLWIEQFEERAAVAGWTKEQKLLQLKAHLEKTARHAVRMLPGKEKDTYEKLVIALQKRFRSLDIEELRGLEFHQLMQEGRSVEELGVELQKLGRKAFPASSTKEFDRILKGRFYQALLPKWQRKLGAPSPSENFDELFARARVVECHDQQYNTGRSGRSQQATPKPNQGSGSQEEPRSSSHSSRRRSRPATSDQKDSPSPQAEPTARPMSSRSSMRHTPRRGCFNCGDPSHFQRDCPKLQPEARGRSSGVSALAGEPKGGNPSSEDMTPSEQSIQQLEQVLASMKLNMEQDKLRKANVGTVISRAAKAVGPVLYLNLKMEGYPIKAVVDSGAQSTIISRSLLHQVADNMRKAGRQVPELVLPSAKLFGRSGADSSELTITAETTVELEVGNRQVTVPVFVQPESDIPCLLGMNALPQLGIRFLDENGTSLFQNSDTPPSDAPLSSDDVAAISGEVPALDSQENDDQDQSPKNSPHAVQNKSAETTNAHTPLVKSNVSLVRSTYLPTGSTRVLEATLQTPLTEGGTLLFEPHPTSNPDGLELPEVLVKQQHDGRILLVAENHSALSSYLKAGRCVGAVTSVEDVSVCAVPTTEQDKESEEVGTPCSHSGVSEPSHAEETTSSLSQSRQPSLCETERLQQLFSVLKLPEESLDDDQLCQLRQLIAKTAKVFALDDSELGYTDQVQHHVETGDTPPIKQSVRRVPFVHRARIAKMVEDMEKQGVVRRSSSAWSSPVVLIPKKDGSYRFCVDYRKLNSVTKKDVYPLPRIDDILDTLEGATYFTTLDLASGYWQIGLDPESAAKSAFITHRGLHEFARMPFGMCNAPATFQRLMEVILSDLLWKSCFVYIDDVLICSRSFDDHLKHLEQVLQRLQDAGLRLKAKKCLFLRQEVPYLGHVVTKDGIRPDPAKTEKMRGYPTPTDVSQVRQFLGLASYYRRFVPGFARIASPLHALLKKDAVFQWGTECDMAFQQLKQALISAPVLAYPQFSSLNPFILETDASTKGLGAVLAQQQSDGKIHPIAFASRSLTPAEKNYTITELESLGLVWAARLFRPYILGHRCVVFTDHAACMSLLGAKSPSSKLVRWAMTIQELDLDIRHRSGKSNRVADALSRNPMNVARVLMFQSVRLPAAEPPSPPADNPLTDVGDVEVDIQQYQHQDPELVQIISYLKDGCLPEDDQLARRMVLEKDHFTVVDNVLFYVGPQNSSSWRLVVPKKLQGVLIEEQHAGRFAGHFAERKMFATLRTRYWWRGMRAAIRHHCRRCLVCASRKGTGRRMRPPLQPIPVGGPFHMVGVDVLQLPLSYQGNQYAVVFMDYFTKWPEVFAVPNQQAETIARLLVEHVISRHGVPEHLLSDRGPNFLSAVILQVCKLMGVTKVNTSGYHPQCDGLVEKFNSTLINMLAKSVEQHGRDWDCQLPYLLFAYRVAVHDSTNYSPFYLLHGREPVLPTATAVTQPRTPYQIDFEDYSAELVANLSDAWALAHQNIQGAQVKQKAQYDKKSKQSQVKVNDRVMVHFPGTVKGKAWKFARPYFGPYKVISLTSTNVEVRRVDQPNGETLFVALDRVRPCYQEMSNEVWVGHGKCRTRSARRGVTAKNAAVEPPSEGYTGPLTRSRSRTQQ